jgi:hypothetical protein
VSFTVPSLGELARVLSTHTELHVVRDTPPLLQKLAPSIAKEAAKEPDPQAAPKERLTILLGAGASIYAGAPTTSALTDSLHAWSLSRAIVLALANDKETKEANFEDVIHVLEECESLKSPVPSRAAQMLRRFVATLPYVNGIPLDRNILCDERFAVMDLIAVAFASLDYDASWHVLANLLRPLLTVFNLDIFTLNYDLLVDVAVEGLSRETGKKWFNGYRTAPAGDAAFQPNEYAHWNDKWGPKYLTLSHLHGSLRYSYAPGPKAAHARRFVLQEGDNLDQIRASWAAARGVALQAPAETFDGIAPIVSGIRKLQKLDVQPYANYYAYFARAVSESPYLLVIGYGKGDEHINYWLQEYAQIHNKRARTVEITDQDNPNTFLVQRIGQAFGDLHWMQDSTLPNVFRSGGGIENLALTCGLNKEPALPTALQELMVSFYKGG